MNLSASSEKTPALDVPESNELSPHRVSGYALTTGPGAIEGHGLKTTKDGRLIL